MARTNPFIPPFAGAESNSSTVDFQVQADMDSEAFKEGSCGLNCDCECRKKCVACDSETVACIFIPCGHVSLCVRCTHRLKRTSEAPLGYCPIDQRIIYQIVRTNRT